MIIANLCGAIFVSSKADDTIASKEKRERERKKERERVQGRDDVTKNERKEQSTLISASLLVARN